MLTRPGVAPRACGWRAPKGGGTKQAGLRGSRLGALGPGPAEDSEAGGEHSCPGVTEQVGPVPQRCHLLYLNQPTKGDLRADGQGRQPSPWSVRSKARRPQPLVPGRAREGGGMSLSSGVFPLACLPAQGALTAAVGGGWARGQEGGRGGPPRPLSGRSVLLTLLHQEMVRFPCPLWVLS